MRKEVAPVVATALAACLLVVSTYALLRVYDVLARPPEQNPATIVWSAHIAMFWRLNIGLYVAAMAAPLVYAAARANLDRTLKLLGQAVVLASLLIGAQGLLFPMTNLLVLRFLERIHGHLGWLAVAALLHPAILLRNPKRRARLSVALATGTLALVGAIGTCIYPPYRDLVKQRLFLDAPRVGWLFERKEHLAVGAIGLALTGCIAHLSLPLLESDEARRTVAVLAHRAFVASFVLALVVATLGLTVASFQSF